MHTNVNNCYQNVDICAHSIKCIDYKNTNEIFIVQQCLITIILIVEKKHASLKKKKINLKFEMRY